MKFYNVLSYVVAGYELGLGLSDVCKQVSTTLQLTVVTQLFHGMDLWRATPAQHMVQRCSIAVTQVWFQKEG